MPETLTVHNEDNSSNMEKSEQETVNSKELITPRDARVGALMGEFLFKPKKKIFWGDERETPIILPESFSKNEASDKK